MAGRVEGGPKRPAWRSAVTGVAVFYLVAVLLDASGISWPARLLPLPLRFFVQVAELFPHAAQDAVEWRAEAFHCGSGRFEELDVRPFFPIRADDKESRFYRAMFFHHRQRPVLEALERYLIREQARLHPDDPIGGVILLSLLVPIPPPGTAAERYQRRPLAEYPPSVARHYWYGTTPAAARRRCEEPR